jgi:hypothetical protein
MVREQTAVPAPSRSRTLTARITGGALLALAAISLARHEGRLESIDIWAIVFAVAGSAGGFLCLARTRAPRWFLASSPLWALSYAHPVCAMSAFGLTLAGLLEFALGPVMPGRTVFRPGDPLPHLAQGPLTPIRSTSYAGEHKNRTITILATGLALAAVGLAVWGGPERPEAVGLGLGAAIGAATLWFSNWFARRYRLRIDEHGLHSRLLFREHSVRWTDVAGITTRYLVLSYGVRLVYFVVFSSTREFAFLSTMPGGAELKTAIEAAIGLRWPEPAFEGDR